MLSVVLVNLDFGRLIPGHVERLIGFRHGARVAGQSTASAAPGTAADVAAVRDICAAHSQVQFRHCFAKFVELGVQVVQVLLVLVLSLVDERAVLGDQQCGAIPGAFGVLEETRGALGGELCLPRLCEHLLRHVQGSLHVRLLQSRGILLQLGRLLMKIVGPVLELLQRLLAKTHALSDVLLEIIDVLQLIGGRRHVVAQLRGQFLELVEILAANGRVVDHGFNLIQAVDHGVELATIDSRGADSLDPRRFVDHLTRLVLEAVQNVVPIVEALAAWTAIGREAEVAAVALIALVAADSLVTQAHPGLPVALGTRRANDVALARLTLHRRIAPVVCLTLVAPSTPESRSALARSVERITSANRTFFRFINK